MNLVVSLIILLFSTSVFAAADPCEVSVSRNTVVADALIAKGYRMPRNREVNQSIDWTLIPSEDRMVEITINGTRALLYKFSSLEAVMTAASGKVRWKNSVPVDIQVFRELETPTPAAAQEIEASDNLAFQKINAALAQVFKTIPACP